MRDEPLPPDQLAELFCAFTPSEAWRALTAPANTVLDFLPAAERAAFAPPSVVTEPDGTRELQFWSFRFPPRAFAR